jgi:hypothetical protein
MNARTVGWCFVLVLLFLPAVVLAVGRETSDDLALRRLPTLVGPVLAQAQKPAQAASPTQAKDKETAKETANDAAKDATKDMVSQEEFNTAMSRIEERLDAITESLARVSNGQRPLQEPQEPQESQVPQEPTPAGEAKPAGQAQTPSQADFDALRDRVYDQEVILANIAKRISQPDGPERYIVDIRGNLQNPTFRNELSDAINEVLPRQGKLHVRNTMETTQTLMVNRQEYRIAPGDRLTVTVPVGSVTTELVGFEAPRNWTIAPPTFEERIVIGPSTAYRAAYRAPESVYGPSTPLNNDAAPVYDSSPVESPVYINSTGVSDCCTGCY